MAIAQESITDPSRPGCRRQIPIRSRTQQHNRQVTGFDDARDLGLGPRTMPRIAQAHEPPHVATTST